MPAINIAIKTPSPISNFVFEVYKIYTIYQITLPTTPTHVNISVTNVNKSIELQIPLLIKERNPHMPTTITTKKNASTNVSLPVIIKPPAHKIIILTKKSSLNNTLPINSVISTILTFLYTHKEDHSLLHLLPPKVPQD